MNRPDVVIAGAGPSGSVAALCLARRGWKVALYEASRYDADRPGETLPPEVNPVLRKLGLWEEFQAGGPVESPGVISSWGSSVPQEVDFTSNAFGFGWHIDRRQFDAMLCEAAEREGVVVFRGRRAEMAGPFMIDATGRNALRVGGSRERLLDDSLLAVVLRVSFSDKRDRDLRTLIEAVPDGWWYSACLPEGDLIAMFFTGRETYRRGDGFVDLQLNQAELTGARMEGGAISRQNVVAVSSSCRKQIAGPGWLATGDSACSFDPLSGRGILKALRHGIAAAEATDAALRHDGEALDRYAAMVRLEFDRYLVQKRSYYRMESRWPDRPFWFMRRQLASASAA